MDNQKRRPTASPAPARVGATPFDINLSLFGAAVRGGLWWATLLALFLAPLLRGLYPEVEQLSAIIVLAVLFALAWLARRDGHGSWSLLDWAVAGMVLVYALSMVVAADIRAAAGETLKFSAYFAVYWLVRVQVRGSRRGVLLDVLIAGGTLVALLGLAAITGLADVPEALVGPRLASTLEYPNTTAAYLTAVLVLALARGEESRRWRPLFALAAFFLAAAVALTYSRGGWLVLPLASLAWLVCLPPSRRLGSAVHLAVVIGTGFAAAFLAVRGEGGGWIWLLIGAAAIVAVTVLMTLLERLPPRPRWVMTALAAFLVAGAVWRIVPPALAPVLGRMGDLVEDASVLQRLVYYYDGWRIVRDRPVLGAGGGGWNALYHTYKAYPYYSRYVHNFVLEHWIATGTVGLAVFVALWCAFLGSAWRACLLGSRLRLAGVNAAAVALGVHSVIDFNLALPAAGVLLFALFGLVRAYAFEGAPPPARRGVPEGAVAVTAALVVAVVAGLFLTGNLRARAGTELLAQGRYAEAAELFERARAVDPLHAQMAVDLAACYEGLALQRGDWVLLFRAREQLETALRLEPHNAFYQQALGTFELSYGSLEKGIKHFERSIELYPTLAGFHGNLARAHVLGSLRALDQGDWEEVRRHAASAGAIYHGAAELAALTPDHAYPSVRMALADPVLTLATGQALLLLGEDEQALEWLQRVGQGEYVSEARLWTAFAMERLGREGAEEMARQALAEDPELVDQFNILLVLLDEDVR